MKKAIFIVICAGVLGLFACMADATTKPPSVLPTPSPIRMTKPPTVDPNYFLTATLVPFYTQVPSPTVVGAPAIINVALNMGSGGAGFSANLYAQEVYTGKTFTLFMSAGMHTASFLPTSPPLDMAVQAPGTYVIYARLSNAPTEYHYGYTECTIPTDCVGSPLIALDVLPGERYTVYIADRKAILPDNDKRGLPVTVPWVKLNP
ncbi:MAG: hypothetical protein HZB18_12770 [Chloroflexi bacterium]|nr:hypothetical protein [Chloroflexota bacterium]